MKSQIKIDVNEANEPVITIAHNHSDDLRDKMVKRFLSGQHESILCLFNYAEGFNPERVNQDAFIRPTSGVAMCEAAFKALKIFASDHRDLNGVDWLSSVHDAILNLEYKMFPKEVIKA